MANQIQLPKRLIERPVGNSLHGRSIHVDELIDQMRREVSLVRREDPSLDDYHLHDITLLFESSEIILQIDFRK